MNVDFSIFECEIFLHEKKNDNEHDLIATDLRNSSLSWRLQKHLTIDEDA